MELNANMPAMQSCHSIADHHFHYTLGLGKVQGVYDMFVHNHMVQENTCEKEQHEPTM